MIVLGIDPGLEVTGWCLLDSRRLVHGCGDVKSGVSLPDRQRRQIICDGVLAVVRAARVGGYGPELASVEQYVYQGPKRSHNRNTFRLSQLVGDLEGALRTTGLRVIGPSRGQALVSVGLLTNSTDGRLREVIQRLGRGVDTDTRMPTNEHQRAAYAAAWWGAQRARAA